MKRIAFFVCVFLVGHTVLAQTIVDDNIDYPILRIKDSTFSGVFIIYDSLMNDSVCGDAMSVCYINDSGIVDKVEIISFDESYPANEFIVRPNLESHLNETIANNLLNQIRKKGVIVHPSNVKINGTRQGFTLPIVIRPCRISSLEQKENTKL